MGEQEKELLKYWQGLRREEGEIVPRRAAINPRDIHRLLPLMIIHERLQPNVMMIRLTGTKVDEILGKNYSGTNVFDIYDSEFHAWLRALHDVILDTPCGARVTGLVTLEDGASFEMSSLHLPMNNARGETTFLLGLIFIEPTYMDAALRGAGLVRQDIKGVRTVDLGFGAPPLEEG